MALVDSLQTVDDCLAAAGSRDQVVVLEEITSIWCEQVEKVRGHLFRDLGGRIRPISGPYWSKMGFQEIDFFTSDLLSEI